MADQDTQTKPTTNGQVDQASAEATGDGQASPEPTVSPSDGFITQGAPSAEEAPAEEEVPATDEAPDEAHASGADDASDADDADDANLSDSDRYWREVQSERDRLKAEREKYAPAIEVYDKHREILDFVQDLATRPGGVEALQDVALKIYAPSGVNGSSGQPQVNPQAGAGQPGAGASTASPSGSTQGGASIALPDLPDLDLMDESAASAVKAMHGAMQQMASRLEQVTGYVTERQRAEEKMLQQQRMVESAIRQAQDLGAERPDAMVQFLMSKEGQAWENQTLARAWNARLKAQSQPPPKPRAPAVDEDRLKKMKAPAEGAPTPGAVAGGSGPEPQAEDHGFIVEKRRY